MQRVPLHKCNKAGCNKLTAERYCEIHKNLNYGYDQQRKSSCKRGYGRAWQKSSKTFLLNHPFCARCLQKNIHTKSIVVDHIVPHKGNQKLFWDKNNWQPLCKQCHDIKTATEDGGFGRRQGGAKKF